MAQWLDNLKNISKIIKRTFSLTAVVQLCLSAVMPFSGCKSKKYFFNRQ
jgi:hypothetical protein